MRKTVLRTLMVLVGGHLVLGVILLVIDATHGINDQDASFAVALLFYYLNLPSIWLLESMGSEPKIAVVIAVGFVQWVGLGLAIGVLLCISIAAFRVITGRTTETAEPTASTDG